MIQKHTLHIPSTRPFTGDCSYLGLSVPTLFPPSKVALVGQKLPSYPNHCGYYVRARNAGGVMWMCWVHAQKIGYIPQQYIWGLVFCMSECVRVSTSYVVCTVLSWLGWPKVPACVAMAGIGVSSALPKVVWFCRLMEKIRRRRGGERPRDPPDLL